MKGAKDMNKEENISTLLVIVIFNCSDTTFNIEK